MARIYDFQETEMNGHAIDFNDYRGKVVLIVNTASKCGLAPQLEGLEDLYQRFHAEGLEVVGLPSNQFRQELGSDKEISEYCQLHYGVTFPMTKPIRVNGAEEDELFTYLKKTAGHGRIKWNFTKFLIGRDGNLIDRFAPVTKPEKLVKVIEAALRSETEPD